MGAATVASRVCRRRPHRGLVVRPVQAEDLARPMVSLQLDPTAGHELD